MDYCKGYFEPNATDHSPAHNTTFCSPRIALFHFNATKIIEDSIPGDISLSDLHWPDAIQDATNAVRVASAVMFVFYCIGIAFAGLAVIGGVIGIFTEGRISACANFLIDIVSLTDPMACFDCTDVSRWRSSPLALPLQWPRLS